jgi:chorismate mutase/prephenate dehydratase
MRELEGLRRKVDAVDRRILQALNERARLSQAIGRVKRDRNEEVYAPDRERKVLDRLGRSNRGPLSREALEAIYLEIMSYSKSVAKPLQIAYLGPEFTFTHEAAQKRFGASVRYVPCASIADVFTEVDRKRCDYGVVPVENSTEGAVTYTLDMFIQSDLKIFDEVYLRISHHLLSRSASIRTVKNVYSNPQAFAQCRNWLEAELPGAKLIPLSSTAEAARRLMGYAARGGFKEAAEFVGKVSKNPKEDACIAGFLAAKKYGLKILAPSIEDQANNTTRFIVISRTGAKPTRSDRTSIVFELKDRVGALHDSLVPFKRAGINLTKIESRPSKKRVWSYYFFVDFDGHVRSGRVRRALARLDARCSFLKVLGSYPKAGA